MSGHAALAEWQGNGQLHGPQFLRDLECFGNHKVEELQ
jgi:hypothetical protein